MVSTATRYWRRSRLKASAVLVNCPLLIAGADRSFSVVGGELPPQGVNQHLFALDHWSLQHARCSSFAG